MFNSDAQSIGFMKENSSIKIKSGGAKKSNTSKKKTSKDSKIISKDSKIISKDSKNILDESLSQNPSMSLQISDIFKLTDLYFMQKNIMYSHLHNSFDKFLDEDVRTLLANGNNVFFEKATKDKIYRYKFQYEDISIQPPILDTEDELMFPSSARKRNLTYASKLVAKITQIQEIIDIATDEVKTKVIGNPEYPYPIAIIPIMVRSKYCSLNLKKNYDKSECEYDPGGYFIVNGSEKVVMSLERIIDNKPLVFTKKDSSSLIYTVQVNSRSNVFNDLLQVVTVRMKKDKTLILRVPILSEVPVFVVIRALGIESDKDIMQYITYDLKDIDMINLVRISLENTRFEGSNEKIRTQDDAIEYLINKMRVIKKYNETDKNIRLQEKKLHLLSLLRNNFLPHIEGDLIDKAYYLGYMINRLLKCYLGRIPIDDRDSYINKRIDLPGNLMFELFKQFYKKMLNECSKFFRKRNNDDNNPINIINQIKPNVIELGLKAALLTGSWGKKKGVAQMLQRFTYLQTISSLRRINSPTVDASTNKLTSPRHLHATQIGFLCVTGDTEVLLSDGVTVKQIKDMTNNDTVLTVNKEDLSIEPSRIKNFFSKMPDKLLKITTQSGREIKCTPDHPLLIKQNNRYNMVRAEDLRKDHEVIIKPLSMASEYSNTKYHMKNRLLDNYDEFMKKYVINSVDNKVYMSIPIDSIEEIGVEPVYDFTTISDNHSFIANGFAVSNCHIETPEGHKVGLVKNLALMGNITISLPSQIFLLRGIVRDRVINIHDIPPEELKEYTKVFLNGEWMGLTDKPRELYKELKQMKYNGEIDLHTGISHEIKSDIESNELKIFCDGGRVFRPILRVDNNELLIKKKHMDNITTDPSDKEKITNWNEFMLKYPGLVEYIDADESFNSMIAMSEEDILEMRKRMEESAKLIKNIKLDSEFTVVNRYDDMTYSKYTHCEIHPSMHIGVVAANIPYCNHNQGPRNIYQYSQARQAMGIYISNYRDRLDISYILYNPQSPLVNTRTMKYLNTDRLPAGENCVVAIACYSG